MVQWSFALTAGILFTTIDYVTTTSKSNFYPNQNLNTSGTETLALNTDLLPNRRSYLMLNNKRNFTFNYNLMRKNYIERVQKSDRSNPKPLAYYNYYSTDNRINGSGNFINSPYLYDILKTNITKIIKNVIKQAQNYTYLINNSNNTFGNLKLKENKKISPSSNGVQNKTLPSLLRTFRSNSNYLNSRNINNNNNNRQPRVQNRRQRNEERDRHRHSKRVTLLKPVNFLLPPLVTDYPELSLQESGLPHKASEQYKSLQKQDDQYTNNKLSSASNFMVYYNNTSLENHENQYYSGINKNHTPSEIQTPQIQKRRKTKQNLTQYALKPPIITLTTSDHIFYVTPKRAQKLQDSQTNLKSLPAIPISYEKASINIYDSRTTTQKTMLFDSKRLDKYYDDITYGVSNNDYDINNAYRNINDQTTLRHQEDTLQSTTQNWLTMSPDYNATNLNQNYEIRNQNYVNSNQNYNTTDFENLITHSMLNDNNFGLRNLSLFYLDNESYSYNKSFKNNYYLPTTSYTSTTEASFTAIKTSKFTDFPTQNIPIHEINSMTTVKDVYYGNQNVNTRDDSEQSFTTVPLLSHDVEKAGMKVYKLADINGNNISQISWINDYNNDEKKEDYSEIERIVQSMTTWKEQYDKDNGNNHEVNFNNTDYNKSYKDTLLTAAETNYYKNPPLFNNPSDYVPHQKDNLSEDNRHVIPGAAGHDYPTLSKPPISSRYSCKNDGRRYVADVSTGCQVFIMCVGDGPGEPMLCPNGTLFSQDYLVCDWWYNVDCR